MATVTGFKASRMQVIEDTTVTSGFVDLSGNLILSRRDGVPINAGYVKGSKGDKGDAGADFTVAAGFIQPFAGSVPPSGWMLCDGSELLRAQYPELFSVIGTTYGSSGPLYFNLPDFRGRTLVGIDGAQIEFNAIGKIGGAKTHILTIAEMPSHSHQWANAGTNNPGSVPANYDDIVGANAFSLGTGPTDPESVLNAIKPRGGGEAHNNLQPFSVVNYVISLGINATVGGGNPVVAQYQGRGTTAERNAVYGIPGTDAQRVSLANQRVQWFNTESGWLEQYYATTGLSGLGVLGLISEAPSGWYPVGPGPEIVMEPSGTFSGSAGGYIGGWNGTVRRKGGSSWFTPTAQSITFGITGIYDFGWWTLQTTGSGEADYHTRLLNSAGTVVDWMSNVAGGQLGSIFRRAEGHYRSQIVRATQKLFVLVQSGSLGLHNASTSVTYPPTRGEMYARYVRPPLVSE